MGRIIFRTLDTTGDELSWTDIEKQFQTEWSTPSSHHLKLGRWGSEVSMGPTYLEGGGA